MRHRIKGALAAACAWSWIAGAAPARAEEDTPPAEAHRSERLGRPGDVVLGNVLGGTASLGGFSGVYAGWLGFSAAGQQVLLAGGTTSTQTVTTLAFTPSVDVLVTSRLTLGGDLVVGRTSSEGFQGDRQTSTSILAVPRIGWLVPLPEDLWLWPRVGLGVGYEDGPAGGGIITRAAAELPLAVSLSRHALLAAGPALAYEQEKVEFDLSNQPSWSRSLSLGFRGGLDLVF